MCFISEAHDFYFSICLLLTAAVKYCTEVSFVVRCSFRDLTLHLGLFCLLSVSGAGG